jgi:CheY-like chemotaxis protein
MKLANVSVRMLRRAIEIYLEIAYANAEPPYSVRAKAAFDEQESLGNTLALDQFEKNCADQNGKVTHYLLRLGNDHYPHMKLGLASCAGNDDDFVFIVDTHDRHFRVDPELPGSDEFRELQLYNDKTKQQIERRWETKSLPTQRQVLENFDEPCRLARECKTVLVVEDEAPIAELERHILECDGYNVVVCLSGKAAIEAAEKDHIDLCLLDIMMPETDGFDVIRTLNERRIRHFPIVFVTAMPATRITLGLADGIITKPFEPHFLLEQVRKYIA